MKFSNPKTRSHLSIKKSYNVLEIGGGNYPHPRANVVVDKYVDSNYHRSGNIKVYPHQKFVLADGESLPFENKEFDYVICCHVLEHIDDPIPFLKEQARVAPMGYIETPSIIGEYLMPMDSHKWLIQEIDGKIVMYDKEVIGFKAWQDFGNVFLNYLPKQSVGYKIMQRTHNNLTNMVYEWSGDIEVLINPEDSYYRDFFTKPWDEATCIKLLKSSSIQSEVKSSLGAILNVVKSFFSSREKNLKDPVI